MLQAPPPDFDLLFIFCFSFFFKLQVYLDAKNKTSDDVKFHVTFVKFSFGHLCL